jgi:hypothetical protein
MFLAVISRPREPTEQESCYIKMTRQESGVSGRMLCNSAVMALRLLLEQRLQLHLLDVRH